MKNVQRLWGLSLMAAGLAALAAALSRLLPGLMPDWAVRLAGIVDLIALPALGFTSVKKLRRKG